MKKVRIILTSVAVLAVVGGALAFKAQKKGSICLFKYDAVNQTCPNILPVATWDQQSPSFTSSSAILSDCSKTDVDKALCTTTTVTFQEQ